jgi:hypothetical protein
MARQKHNTSKRLAKCIFVHSFLIRFGLRLGNNLFPNSIDLIKFFIYDIIPFYVNNNDLQSKSESLIALFFIDKSQDLWLIDKFTALKFIKDSGGTMAQELEILKNSTVFNSLELSDLQRLGSLMEPLEIQEGETLATMGEEATRFFILASGTLLVAMDGGKALVMDEPGGFIAMQILSSNGKYLSTVTALEPGLVFVLNKTDFIDLIQEDSLMADMIMEEWNVFLEESAPFVEDKGTPGFEYNY